MPYAILQKDLTVPAVEALRRAFRSVRCLTDADASILANDAYGILVKNLGEADAATLQGALQVEGIETELLDQRILPELPATKFVSRLDCQPEALMIYDPLGRSFPVEWRHLMLLAAGNTRLHEFRQLRVERPGSRYYGSDYDGYVEPIVETRVREELNQRLLLEIILTRAVARYSVNADKFNFSYLGERMTTDVTANFALLVRDLATHAPHAQLNRGAHQLREGVAEVFSYPSKNAFFEEITWLLWRLRQAG
jgi:hypothetical protein